MHGEEATVETLDDPTEWPAVPPRGLPRWADGSTDRGTLAVEHSYEQSVDGRRLPMADDHDVGAQYLAHYNDVVVSE